MSDRIPGGYMLVAKKIFNSELMMKPPLYSKLFLWMLSQASFKTTGNLARGEFVTSISEMQEAMTYYVGYRKEMPTIKQIRSIYKWFANKSTGDATKGTMIVTTKVTGGLKISISNYDYYQSPVNYEGHNEGHDERATGGHTLQVTPYNKKEENICAKPQSTPKAHRKHLAYPQDFEEVWKVYPNGKNKKKSYERWSKMNGTRPSNKILIAAIKAQMPEWAKDGYRYAPMFSTWLNDERWTDEAPTIAEEEFLN
jgi:hypothetical protein